MKALETPEEKRQRRLAKKEQKELSRRRKMGWDKQMIVRRREITEPVVYCLNICRDIQMQTTRLETSI